MNTEIKSAEAALEKIIKEVLESRNKTLKADPYLDSSEIATRIKEMNLVANAIRGLFKTQFQPNAASEEKLYRWHEIKSENDLPDVIGKRYFLRLTNGLLFIGWVAWKDKKSGIKQFYEIDRPDWNLYPIENATHWLEEINPNAASVQPITNPNYRDYELIVLFLKYHYKDNPFRKQTTNEKDAALFTNSPDYINFVQPITGKEQEKEDWVKIYADLREKNNMSDSIIKLVQLIKSKVEQPKDELQKEDNEAVEFANFLLENYRPYDIETKSWKLFDKTNNFKFTTAELYEQFKLSKL